MSSSPSLTGRFWSEPLLPGVYADPHLLARDLAERRGLQDALHGERQTLRAPDGFPEMGRACERIAAAMKSGERIAVFGDYDADGVTATALLARCFKRHGVTPLTMLPHREREGYGIKRMHIDRLHEAGATLVITVDTGIVAVDEIAYAASLGIDIIVTDHHAPLRGRPPAYAVLHPLIPAPFGNPHLSGAGVAFHLVRALEHVLTDGASAEGWPGIGEDLLLATIGTIADMVPLMGENRTLVKSGLSCMRHLPPESPLGELLAASGGTVTARDVGFLVAPLLNAAGRIAEPEIALQAILEGGDHIARLLELNERRRELTHQCTEKARQLLTDSAFHCVMDASFPPGLLGLVASRITRDTGRPSLAATARGGIVTCSLRSVPGFSLTDVFADADISALLLTAGGHGMAGGCTCAEEHFPALTAKLAAFAQARMKNEGPVRIPVTAMLDPRAIGSALHDRLSTLEPFGSSNEHPLFLLPGVRLDDAQCVGADKSHLKFRMNGLSCIAFRLGHLLPTLQEKRDLLCAVNKRTWNDRAYIELVVEDMR